MIYYTIVVKFVLKILLCYSIPELRIRCYEKDKDREQIRKKYSYKEVKDVGLIRMLSNLIKAKETLWDNDETIYSCHLQLPGESIPLIK